MFSGDEVDDQVSVGGPLCCSYVLCDPDGREGGKIGGRGGRGR